MNIPNKNSAEFKKFIANIKALKIPIVDNCDPGYTGECLCTTGSVDIQAGTNVTITGTGTNADPYIINATGGSTVTPRVNYTFLPTTNIPAVTAIVPPTIPSPLLTGSIEIVKYFNGETIWQYNGTTWDFMSIDYTNGPIINP